MKWGHFIWPGDLTLSDLGLKFSQHRRKRCMIKVCQKWGAYLRRFMTIWQKRGGVLNSPLRLKVYQICIAVGFLFSERYMSSERYPCIESIANLQDFGPCRYLPVTLQSVRRPMELKRESCEFLYLRSDTENPSEGGIKLLPSVREGWCCIHLGLCRPHSKEMLDICGWSIGDRYVNTMRRAPIIDWWSSFQYCCDKVNGDGGLLPGWLCFGER